jgi:Putative transmembrane protein (Alph_Pro_TM)
MVVIRGGGKDEFFNRKGRVGIIWLNTDRIHIKRAPSVFLTFSSDNANSLLDRESLDEYQLDEAAIKKQIQCLRHYKCKLSGGREQ